MAFVDLPNGELAGNVIVMSKALHTTNYRDTFIQVAEDCPTKLGLQPPLRAGQPTIACLQYAMRVKRA